MKIVRNEIKELQKMGRMPNESLEDPDSIDDLIDRYDELLESIEKPIALEEAKILIGLFPDTAFYDLHWTLLHLIESIFNKISIEEYQLLIQKCPSEEWKETLTTRVENTK